MIGAGRTVVQFVVGHKTAGRLGDYKRSRCSPVAVAAEKLVAWVGRRAEGHMGWGWLQPLLGAAVAVLVVEELGLGVVDMGWGCLDPFCFLS